MSFQDIVWEAPEFKYRKKSVDWYWALGLIGAAAGVTAIILSNVLFGVFILVGTLALILQAMRRPRIVTFAITRRGLSINNALYPFSALKSFWISEYDEEEKLLIKSQKIMMPLITIPLRGVDVANLQNILSQHLPEEELFEPLAHKIFELLGF